jgi:hypothetical protein
MFPSAVQKPCDTARSGCLASRTSHAQTAIRQNKLESGHRQVSSIIDVLIGEIDHMKTLPPPSKGKIGFDL